ncbi:hypothetical protein C4J81_16535 [Deltaproteobacteria bacterium Smac51]|nr:hypothetical protein C4J81_16535 [Deltaproteobacteria bacterium Smac51]
METGATVDCFVSEDENVPPVGSIFPAEICEYKPALPLVNWFGPFRQAYDGQESNLIGWTDGIILIMGELPLGLLKDKEKPADVGSSLERLKIKNPIPVRPAEATGVRVIMRRGCGAAVRVLSRPMVDLALSLHPGGIFEIDDDPASDDSVHFKSQDGHLAMIMAPRREKAEEILINPKSQPDHADH